VLTKVAQIVTAGHKNCNPAQDPETHHGQLLLNIPVEHSPRKNTPENFFNLSPDISSRDFTTRIYPIYISPGEKLTPGALFFPNVS